MTIQTLRQGVVIVDGGLVGITGFFGLLLGVGLRLYLETPPFLQMLGQTGLTLACVAGSLAVFAIVFVYFAKQLGKRHPAVGNFHGLYGGVAAFIGYWVGLLFVGTLA